MDVINIPESKRVRITGIKYNLECKTCGHKWGTYLTAEYLPQENWDICLRCVNAKENMNDEQVRDIERVL
jgi:hypothetical protein